MGVFVSFFLLAFNMRKLKVQKQFSLAKIGYMVVAWHIFGIAIYTWAKKRKLKDDPEWDKKTSEQKYLSFMEGPQAEGRNVRKIHIKGTNISIQDTTFEDLTKGKA